MEDGGDLVTRAWLQEARRSAGTVGEAKALEDLAGTGGQVAQMLVFRKMKLGTRWMMDMMGHQMKGT